MLMAQCNCMIKVILSQYAFVLGFLEELRNRVLINVSTGVRRIPAWRLTLDMSLKTDASASRNNATTSCKLASIDSSSLTARVMREARLFRRL